MKLNKFSKFIYIIASLCCLNAEGSNALNQKILDARKNTLDTKMPIDSKQIASGQCGGVYKLANDDSKLIKQIFLYSEPDDDIHEMDVANLMKSDDVPSTLMKVYEVARPTKSSLWYSFEKIDGCSAEDYLKGIKEKKMEKIPWGSFCKNWVVGLFEGMKYIQDKIGTVTMYNHWTKKTEDCFAVLSDRNASNIMVRKNNTPVHIDYGFTACIPINPRSTQPNKNIAAIADMLLKFLRSGVKTPREEKESKKLLEQYLLDIKEKPMTKTLLDEIIGDVKQIAHIN